MLAPVYQLLFGPNINNDLGLTEDQLKIHYETYKCDNLDDMHKIVDEKLTPGRDAILSGWTKLSVASVRFGDQGAEHAMVLDTYDSERDVLIFKNTYDDPSVGLTKNFEIERTEPNAPRELYFVQIEIQDMNNLPSQDERMGLLHAKKLN